MHRLYPEEAPATVRVVIADLSHVCERLCTQPAQAQPAAGLLDHLATEIGKAARMLRTPARTLGAPQRESEQARS